MLAPAAFKQRIVALAEHVNQRRLERFLALAGRNRPSRTEAAATWLDEAGAALAEMLAPERTAPPAPVVLAEQEEFHPLLGGHSAGSRRRNRRARGRISGHENRRAGPARLSGRHAGRSRRRAIGTGRRPKKAPMPTSGLRDPELLVGRTGIERCGDAALARPARPRRRSASITAAMRSGWSIAARRKPGGDIVLAIDPVLQRAAESLLDDACHARPARRRLPEGAAAVVMDVETGELWVSASAPRFDPRMLGRWRLGPAGRAVCRAEPSAGRPRGQDGDSARLGLQNRSRPWRCWKKESATPTSRFFARAFSTRPTACAACFFASKASDTAR